MLRDSSLFDGDDAVLADLVHGTWAMILPISGSLLAETVPTLGRSSLEESTFLDMDWRPSDDGGDGLFDAKAARPRWGWQSAVIDLGEPSA